MSALDNIPLTKPTLDEKTIASVAAVLRSGWITSGPKVKEFESRLSELFDNRPVRVFNSGTASLEVALRLAEIGEGDEVITTPLSWVATSNVILNVGAKPVFVDIDPVTRNIDLNAVAPAVTPATKAIMPVDLAGLPVDRDRLYEVAESYGLRVIEDAAQSLGSLWKGRRIGSIGDLVSFSFHPNKNLTSIEGGCLVMNDEDEAKLAEQFRLQGVVRSGVDGMDVAVAGGKFNLTDVAAAVGLCQLDRLDEFNSLRQELVKEYFHQFSLPEARGVGIELPIIDMTQSNWHMFQIVLSGSPRTPSRAEVMQRMADMGISTGVHYPAIHLFSLYQKEGWREGDFPHAEHAGRNILTLPLFPTMSLSDVKRVVDSLVQALKQ